MRLYHGSSQIIEKPLHNGSRDKTDFGQGFYLTADEKQAKRWCVRGDNPTVNCYEIIMDQIKIYEFSLSIEWLLFIIYNRGIGHFNRAGLESKFAFLKEYDVIIGPTADDRMYNTLEEFFDGDLSVEKTLDILNCMNLSKQYLIRTIKGIENTKFVEGYQLAAKELDEVKKENHIFITSIRETVKIHQRKQYDKETYIEDMEETIENGA